MQHFDAIVLGLGGMGSAALHALAQRGVRARGVEQFELAHNRGSSHGHTRLIRRAYFEHPGYVPMVDAAWTAWRELEAETGANLLRQTGLLLAGPADGTVIRGTRAAATMHGLPIATLSHAEATERWPGFAFGADTDVLFEADAGVLFVEDCVRAHLSAAINRGAVALFNRPVTTWRADAKGVHVTTDAEMLSADQLILCGGAWTSRLLAGAQPPLRVLRKPVVWYPNCSPEMHADAGCPVFGFDTPAGFCYGFPQLDARGVKVANHTGGPEVVDPDTVERAVADSELADVEAFRARHLPGVAGPPGRSCVCLYTMTPDEHFIVDRHPRHDNVIVACGLSGHGFKFAPVIGRIVAGAACGEAIEHGLLRPLRPAPAASAPTPT